MFARVLIVAALSAAPLFAVAQSANESWTPSMRTEFRKSCAAELERAGMNTSASWQYCDCITESAEDEFGLADFGYLAASGERDMPEITRRTDRAVSHCFD